MNPTEQPRGNFVINLNFKRNGNPKAPPITGRISTPEDPETEFAFSAFKHVDDEGKPYWIGPVDMNRSMRQALTAQSEKGTHFVAIRLNGFRVFKELEDGSLNPDYAALTPEQQAHQDSKPAFWGSWTRTAAEPQLRAAAWDRDPARYGPWASGNTQHPITKDQAGALLSQPEPKVAPRRAKSGERERA